MVVSPPVNWMNWWLSFLQTNGQMILRIWLWCAGLSLLERLRPIQPDQPLRHWWFNLQWIIWSVLVGSLLLQSPWIAAGLQGLRRLLGGPYVQLHLPDTLFGAIAAMLLFGLLLDFFYYWMHRFQHTTWLWPQHKLHHSERWMNASTGHRHHWLENLLAQLTIWLPIQALVDIQPLNLTWVLQILMVWNYFVHLNLKLDLGWLSPILGGPQLHWIHHSFAPQHWDKNFAPYFPIWDVLFGTYCAPKPGEFPPSGLPHGENIERMWQAHLLPWKEWWQGLRRSPLSRYFSSKSRKRNYH